MPPTPGYLLNYDATAEDIGKDRLEFQFNPEEVTHQIGIAWGSHGIPGASHPRLHWGGSGSVTWAFTIQFHRLDDNVTDFVAQRVNLLESWTKAQYADDGQVSKGPPRLLFVMGSLVNSGVSPGRIVVLRSVAVKYTLFDEDMEPRAADVELSLEEFVRRSVDARTIRQ